MMGSIRQTWLEEIFREQEDPWQFTTNPLEAEKYARTLAVLPRDRYRSALEIGCAEGVFTVQAAARADSLLGVDLSTIALERARQRCATLPNVRFETFDLIEDDFTQQFGLIFCAEVLYYIEPPQRLSIARKIAGALAPGGDLVLVHARRRQTRHWTNWTTVYGDSGGEGLHRLFTGALGLPLVAKLETPDYLITVVRAAGVVSSAWRRRFTVAQLNILSAYPLVRLGVRTRVRRHPLLLRGVQTARARALKFVKQGKRRARP